MVVVFNDFLAYIESVDLEEAWILEIQPPRGRSTNKCDRSTRRLSTGDTAFVYAE